MSMKKRPTDPNKYSKNIDIVPESKMSVFLSFVCMGLMLTGIIGLTLELFREGGWIKTLLNKIFQNTTSMMAIPVIIFGLWLLNRWITSPNKSEVLRAGDLPMYAMMAVGAYYLFRLLTTGSF